MVWGVLDAMWSDLIIWSSCKQVWSLKIKMESTRFAFIDVFFSHKTKQFNKGLLGNSGKEASPRATKHIHCLRNNTVGILIFTHNLRF